MSRQKRKDALPPFVALPWDMLNHKAYRDLPPSAAKVLPYFLGKPKKMINKPEFYEVRFRFPYGEADRYGFAPATFSKIIKDLLEFGFIDAVDKGGLKSDGKGYNVFKASQRWHQYGTRDFVRKTWECSGPVVKASSKIEIDRFKNGTESSESGQVTSETEAVGTAQ